MDFPFLPFFLVLKIAAKSSQVSERQLSKEFLLCKQCRPVKNANYRNSKQKLKISMEQAVDCESDFKVQDPNSFRKSEYSETELIIENSSIFTVSQPLIY